MGEKGGWAIPNQSSERNPQSRCDNLGGWKLKCDDRNIARRSGSYILYDTSIADVPKITLTKADSDIIIGFNRACWNKLTAFCLQYLFLVKKNA